MPLYPPQAFRKTEFTHRIGLAAARPAAADVLPGTLYFSTDTGVIERSNGAAWASYSGAATTDASLLTSGTLSNARLDPLVQIGAWTAFTPVRSASGGTWSGGTTATKYKRLGEDTLVVAFELNDGSVSASSAALYMDIPGGFVAVSRMFAKVAIARDVPGSNVEAYCRVVTSGTQIQFWRTDDVNWSATTGGNVINGLIIFEI